MFELTDLIERNQTFAANRPEAGPLPRQALFLLTCIDPRTDPAAFVGLLPGDAPVMRNAGGRVTDSVIADVAFIAQLAGAMGADPEGPLFEVVIIHHSQCGTGFLANEGFRHTLVKATGYDDAELTSQAVTDPEATVRADVAKLRAATQVNPRVRVSGHVYDLDTGLVTTVVRA